MNGIVALNSDCLEQRRKVRKGSIEVTAHLCTRLDVFADRFEQFVEGPAFRNLIR